MTIHYHGTPLSPIAKLYELAGRHFCVPFPRPDDIARCHQIGQSVMLDNGAFSAWKRGVTIDWKDYYAWVEEWSGPTTWAVIPDVIGGGEDDNNQLLGQWPFFMRGAPVWHMEQSIKRLLMLADEYDKICIGSSARYSVVMDQVWQRRMDEVWNAIAKRFSREMPWVHMLRGMQVAGERWPFASLDSTDIARNHNRPHNSPRAMADRWDAMQCPMKWEPRPEQMELIDEMSV